MNSKAIRKQLLAAVAMVLVAAVALGSSTYAWFAANRRVTATDMKVTATTSSSLVISNKLNVGTSTTVGMSTSISALIPATHDSSVRVGSTLSTKTDGGKTVQLTGLKYNTNPQAVSAQTGYAAGTTELTFDDAINVAADSASNIAAKDYYVDYVVYVASAGSQMEKTGLNVYLFTGSAIDADTTRATSVDFYVKEDSTELGAYKGTLNLSALTSTPNDDGVTYYTNSVELLPKTSTIPQNNSSSDYLQITMRVYYDGALQKSAANGSDPAQAFVYSDKVTTEGTAFSASFNAFS